MSSKGTQPKEKSITEQALGSEDQQPKPSSSSLLSAVKNMSCCLFVMCALLNLIFTAILLAGIENYHKPDPFKVYEIFETPEYAHVNHIIDHEQYVILEGSEGSGILNFVEHEANLRVVEGKPVVITDLEEDFPLEGDLKDTRQHFLELYLGDMGRGHHNWFIIINGTETPDSEIFEIKAKHPRDSIIIIALQSIYIDGFTNHPFPALSVKQIKKFMTEELQIPKKQVKALVSAAGKDVSKLFRAVKEHQIEKQRIRLQKQEQERMKKEEEERKRVEEQERRRLEEEERLKAQQQSETQTADSEEESKPKSKKSKNKSKKESSKRKSSNQGNVKESKQQSKEGEKKDSNSKKNKKVSKKLSEAIEKVVTDNSQEDKDNKSSKKSSKNKDKNSKSKKSVSVKIENDQNTEVKGSKTKSKSKKDKAKKSEGHKQTVEVTITDSSPKATVQDENKDLQESVVVESPIEIKTDDQIAVDQNVEDLSERKPQQQATVDDKTEEEGTDPSVIEQEIGNVPQTENIVEEKIVQNEEKLSHETDEPASDTQAAANEL